MIPFFVMLHDKNSPNSSGLKIVFEIVTLSHYYDPRLHFKVWFYSLLNRCIYHDYSCEEGSRLLGQKLKCASDEITNYYKMQRLKMTRKTHSVFWFFWFALCCQCIC